MVGGDDDGLVAGFFEEEFDGIAAAGEGAAGDDEGRGEGGLEHVAPGLVGGEEAEDAAVVGEVGEAGGVPWASEVVGGGDGEAGVGDFRRGEGRGVGVHTNSVGGASRWWCEGSGCGRAGGGWSPGVAGQGIRVSGDRGGCGGGGAEAPAEVNRAIAR